MVDLVIPNLTTEQVASIAAQAEGEAPPPTTPEPDAEQTKASFSSMFGFAFGKDQSSRSADLPSHIVPNKSPHFNLQQVSGSIATTLFSSNVSVIGGGVQLGRLGDLKDKWAGNADQMAWLNGFTVDDDEFVAVLIGAGPDNAKRYDVAWDNAKGGRLVITQGENQHIVTWSSGGPANHLNLTAIESGADLSLGYSRS